MHWDNVMIKTLQRKWRTFNNIREIKAIKRGELKLFEQFFSQRETC